MDIKGFRHVRDMCFDFAIDGLAVEEVHVQKAPKAFLLDIS